MESIRQNGQVTWVKKNDKWVKNKVWANRHGRSSRYVAFKIQVRKAVRWVLIRAGITVGAVVLLFAGYWYADVTAPNLSAVNAVVHNVIAAAPIKVAPILKQICGAESGCKQFRKNGLPVFHANTNGTVDIGKYQINDAVWGAKAKELGYDLLTEEGNEAMAMWILDNKGTEPWYSSKGGWKK